MKILVFWDIYGRIWRKGFLKEIEGLKTRFKPDFTVVNIENITSGRGPVTQHAEMIEAAWIDVMTWGDHIFDNVDGIRDFFKKEKCNLIRPANFYDNPSWEILWEGSIIVEKDWKRLLVIQLLWEAFMSHKVQNPFLKIDEILAWYSESDYDGVLVDFHRETTAELYGMAHHLDSRVSLVYGTHTHVQTNDAQVLPGGTWLIGDVGMNGPSHSVIGAEFDSVKKRFLSGIQRGKIEQALWKQYLINAVYLEIDPKSKKTLHIENISYKATL